jgi:hypothetical protein
VCWGSAMTSGWDSVHTAIVLQGGSALGASALFSRRSTRCGPASGPWLSRPSRSGRDVTTGAEGVTGALPAAGADRPGGCSSGPPAPLSPLPAVPRRPRRGLKAPAAAPVSGCSMRARMPYRGPTRSARSGSRGRSPGGADGAVGRFRAARNRCADPPSSLRDRSDPGRKVRPPRPRCRTQGTARRGRPGAAVALTEPPSGP